MFSVERWGGRRDAPKDLGRKKGVERRQRKTLKNLKKREPRLLKWAEIQS